MAAAETNPFRSSKPRVTIEDEQDTEKWGFSGASPSELNEAVAGVESKLLG